MKPAPAFLSFLLTVGIFCSNMFSQDVRVRQEAEQLLERASAVSTPAHLPNLERTDAFRVFGADGAQEGTFTRVVIQGTGRRDEYNFGTFRLINVFRPGQVAVSGTAPIAPSEIVNLLRLTPIALVRFDQQDLIRSIVNREVGGHRARCIEFDTISGAGSQSNELCVDQANGTLVAENLNGSLVENSDFFAFAGGLIPGSIRYSEAGILKMEITQTMTELKEVTPNVLEAPPDAHIGKQCVTFRRAFGVSMPQPKAGSATGEAVVVVRGNIGQDGRVHDALVQDSERVDLNEEALSLIEQWVFAPAMCNGTPNRTEASFELHFQGR